MAWEAQANWLNIKFGIAFKPGELSGGPLSSSMNYVGSISLITIIFIGNKLCLGK